MGKSAGKWIKTLLYGKKKSKLSTSRGRGEVCRYSIFANEKGILGPPKALEVNTVVTQPITSQSYSYDVDRKKRKKELDRKDSDSSQEDGILAPGNQSLKAEESAPEEAHYDSENCVLGVAAAKVQATFRGYLARRAFHALKGIIRLQALMRGHLVRRQAVATLYCMAGIVKFQAINRGRQIRQSSIGLEVLERCDLAKAKQSKLRAPGVNPYAKMAKLSGNKFICKLLSLSPTGMPLHLSYGPEDPNSVLIWLERWSAFRFWKPVSQTKKHLDRKSRRQLASDAFGNAEMGRPKHSVRRVLAANIEILAFQPFSESEKPSSNLRNLPYRPAYLVQENPQLELEKVKRNLRKVHNPELDTSAKIQSEVEKPDQVLKKESSSSGREILEQLKQDTVKPSDSIVHETMDHNVQNLSESMQKDMSLMVSNFPDVEKALLPLQKIDSFANSVDEPKLGIESIDNYIDLKNGNAKEEPKRKDNQKSSNKTSNAVKQDPAENVTQNSPTPTLPSYMAATESAKAKLRLQGSPRLSQDGGEKNSAMRHHSLPSGTYTKIRSHSPRTRRSIQGDGKGGNKSDKQSPKDGYEKADWRR